MLEPFTLIGPAIGVLGLVLGEVRARRSARRLQEVPGLVAQAVTEVLDEQPNWLGPARTSASEDVPAAKSEREVRADARHDLPPDAKPATPEPKRAPPVAQPRTAASYVGFGDIDGDGEPELLIEYLSPDRGSLIQVFDFSGFEAEFVAELSTPIPAHFEVAPERSAPGLVTLTPVVGSTKRRLTFYAWTGNDFSPSPDVKLPDTIDAAELTKRLAVIESPPSWHRA